MAPQRTLDWLALNLLSGIGPRAVRTLVERHGDPGEVAHRVPLDELRATPGIGPKTAEKIRLARRSLRRDAEREWRRAEKLGVRVLLRGEPVYPADLETIFDPPPVLYLLGELRQDAVRVAVVGARRATAYGLRVATGLASGLAARGVEVVSGGARGIDGAAHLGALEDRGRTVAVLGSGLERVYPPEHHGLFERIAAAGGGVLSEFPLGQGPHPGNFPRRNRVISGLAAAVVVVEAAERSGSLVTAAHALEQGRDVLAVPGPVTSERSVGCHALIRDGAGLVQNVDDVVAELPPGCREAVLARGQATAVPQATPEPGGGALTPDEAAVLELLDDVEPLQLETLADRAPFGIARLQSALFGLEVQGLVDCLAGARYVRSGRPVAG